MDDSEQHVGLPGTAQRGRLSRILQKLNTREFHSWIQTGVLLVATSWGMYTFVWRDILVPSWAPAHINLSISLTTNEDISTKNNSHEEGFLTIKADNPSGRKLYLLSNVWQMFGSTRVTTSPQEFQSTADLVLRTPALMHVERGSSLESSPILAMGRVFDDTMIQPGESISRSISVKIPKRYTSFEVNVILPALTQAPGNSIFRGKQLEWGLGKEENLIPLLCSRPTISQAGTGNQRNLNCKPEPVEYIETSLAAFDRRMLFFTISKQIMPTLTGG